MTKRRKKIIIIIFLIIICVVGIFKFTETGNYVRYALTVYDSKVGNFDKYKKDYQVIADKVIKLRDEEIITKEANYVVIGYGQMFNSTDYKEIELTEKEKQSLLNIETTFDQENYPMYMVRAYEENYIAFMPEGYPFGVVYSENGTRPRSLGALSEEDRNYRVKNLAPKWYDVEDK